MENRVRVVTSARVCSRERVNHTIKNDYLNSTASSSGMSEGIYDRIKDILSVKDEVCQSRLPEQDSIDNHFDGQSTITSYGSCQVLACSIASARSTYSLDNKTDDFMHLCKVLKGMIHEYDEILLEQSDIGLDHTPHPENERIYESINDGSSISINRETTKPRDNIGTTLSVRSLHTDDEVISNENTLAVARSSSMPKVEGLYTLQNRIHDKLKMALESLPTELVNFRTTRLQRSEDHNLRRQDQDTDDESQYVVGRIPRPEKRLGFSRDETVGELIGNSNDAIPVFHDTPITERNEKQDHDGHCDTDNTNLKHTVDNGGEENISTLDSACDLVDSSLFQTSYSPEQSVSYLGDDKTRAKEKQNIVLKNIQTKLNSTSLLMCRNKDEQRSSQYDNKISCVDNIAPDSSSQSIRNDRNSSVHTDVEESNNLQAVTMKTLDLKIRIALDSESTRVKSVYSDSSNEDDFQNDSACSSGVSTMSSETQNANDSNSSVKKGSLQFNSNLQQNSAGFTRTAVDNNRTTDTEHSVSSTETGVQRITDGINSYNKYIYLDLDFDELVSEDEDIVEKCLQTVTPHSPTLHELKDCNTMPAPLNDRIHADDSIKVDFDTDFTNPKRVFVKEAEDEVLNVNSSFAQCNIPTCVDGTYPESSTIYVFSELSRSLSDGSRTSEEKNKPLRDDLNTPSDTADSIKEDSNIKDQP